MGAADRRYRGEEEEGEIERKRERETGEDVHKNVPTNVQ